MGGLSVLQLRFRGSVGLNQDEMRGIIQLLHKVEGGDSGFFDTLSGVDNRGLTEGFYRFGFHVNMDMND